MLMRNGMPGIATRGFTLIELLVVIAIIAVLAGLILPVLAESRRRARITQCTSQMQQFHKAVFMWDEEHDRYHENYPDRLVRLNLEGGYLKDGRVFQCPLDPHKGKEGGKPPTAAQQFPETDEGPGKNGLPANAPYSSYLYEFNGAKCSWWSGGTVVNGVDTDGNGEVSWQEAKFYQQRYGDAYLYSSGWNGEYPRTWFPLVRCFWHAKFPDKDTETEILNISMDGNPFNSGPKWEIIAVQNLPK